MLTQSFSFAPHQAALLFFAAGIEKCHGPNGVQTIDKVETSGEFGSDSKGIKFFVFFSAVADTD